MVDAPTPEEVRVRVGARIRELAKRRHLTPAQVAEAAGISRTHVWGILSGRTSPTVDVLTKIAAALEVDPVALVRPYKGKPPAAPVE